MAQLDAHLKTERESTRIEHELREKAKARQLIGKEAIDRETRIFLTHATISPYSGSKNPKQIKYFISEIVRISDRFSLNDIQLITLSGRNMTGRAKEWFSDYRGSTKFRIKSFQQFTQDLIHHFLGVYDNQEHVEHLINLKQENGVDEYRSHFNFFLQKLPEEYFTEEQKVLFYIAGLNPEIKIEVQLENSATLIETIEISLTYEDAIKYGRFENNQVEKVVELGSQKKVKFHKYSDQDERKGHDELKIDSTKIKLHRNMKYICYNCSKEGHFASQCPESEMAQKEA